MQESTKTHVLAVSIAVCAGVIGGLSGWVLVGCAVVLSLLGALQSDASGE